MDRGVQLASAQILSCYHKSRKIYGWMMSTDSFPAIASRTLFHVHVCAAAICQNAFSAASRRPNAGPAFANPCSHGPCRRRSRTSQGPDPRRGQRLPPGPPLPGRLNHHRQPRDARPALRVHPPTHVLAGAASSPPRRWRRRSTGARRPRRSARSTSSCTASTTCVARNRSRTSSTCGPTARRRRCGSPS